MNFLRGVFDQLVLTWRLLRDGRIVWWVKAIPLATLIYIFSPIDLLPDFIPFLGQIDDLALLMGAMRLMEALAPEAVVKEHRRRIEAERKQRARPSA